MVYTLLSGLFSVGAAIGLLAATGGMGFFVSGEDGVGEWDACRNVPDLHGSGNDHSVLERSDNRERLREADNRLESEFLLWYQGGCKALARNNRLG